MTSPRWKHRPLGQLLGVQNGFAFDSDKFASAGGTPLIRIRDLKSGTGTQITYKGSYDPRFVVHKGDLLIGMDGEFRCYVWQGGDALLNQRVCRLVDFSDEIEPEFVRFGIDTHLKTIEDATPYVTVKHLSAKSIRAIEFAYPDRVEQRRIVARIKECMERVQEIERTNGELVGRVSGVLRSARRKFLGSPAMMPNGWHEERLDELADVIYGISAAISANRDPSIGPPIVRMANMSLDGHLDLSDMRYCEIPAGRDAHFLLKRGDLLLNWRSGSAQHVGKTAIFDVDGRYTCASFILRIRAFTTTSNRYLRHVLNFMRAEGLFSDASRMQINHKLNAAEFSAFPIRVPPARDEQERIADVLDNAEKLGVQVAREMQGVGESAQFLRGAILRKAFAGEL